MIFLKVFTIVVFAFLHCGNTFAAKLTMKAAKNFASKANRKSDIPIVMNDQVLDQLNKFLSTAHGRRHIKICLKRMKKYEPIISSKIKKQKLPLELMAIPFIESSYENKHSEQGWGSGLWMFIKSTAKVYGLRVDKKIDQRLNVRLSTDAALKYLKANHKRFKDWHLALLAYNTGEYKVKKAIKKTGSRDAWTLIRKGHYGDRHYLAKIMAVLIIMKNPQVLNF